MESVPDRPDQTRETPDPDEFIPPWQQLSDEQLRDMSMERGVDYVDPPPSMPKELACSEQPPCTDFLADPPGVLRDEERWPDHLCYEFFLRRSTYEWASSNLVALSTPELVQWQLEWPLPVGKAAVALRLGTIKGEILNLAPLQEQEEALWAVHIKTVGCTLDLFGLGTPYRQGEDRAYEMGELRYILQGGDTSLFNLVERAKRWWDGFRGKGTIGRPKGSGTWESSMEFWIALRAAVRATRTANQEVTQENVASYLRCDDCVLRRWVKQYGISWNQVLKIP